MGQLLLVRHGQASWGTDDYDVLSPLGWQQSRLLGEALRDRGLVADVVVQGSMRRHRETAQAVIETAEWDGVEIVEDQGWNEFDASEVLERQGAPTADGELTHDQVQAWFAAATTRWSAGGHDGEYEEPFPAFGARVGEALLRTVGLLESNAVALVVTSGGPISLSSASLLVGSPGNQAASYAGIWAQLTRVVVNASLTKVVTGQRGTTLVSFNEHSHLVGDRFTYR